jgi:hypothetical protein
MAENNEGISKIFETTPTKVIEPDRLTISKTGLKCA